MSAARDAENADSPGPHPDADLIGTWYADGRNGTGNVAVSAGGEYELVTRQLTIAASVQLDLKDNPLIVDYSSVSPIGIWAGPAYDGVTGMITSGRIIVSTAVATLTTLGVAKARDALQISGTRSVP